jgi:hypothetical protein
MSKKKTCWIIVFTLLNLIDLTAQTDSSKSVKGWTVGGVPVIAYNADFGLKYGALANFYFYGDQGIRYPYYDHSLFFEATNTTNGERNLRFRYDARQLIHEGRFFVEVQQLLTLYRPFYGFNGYESYFDNNYTIRDSDSFISPLYYYFNQKRWSGLIRLDKNLMGKQYRFQGRAQYNHIEITSTDREIFNKGKAMDDQAPDTATLYDQYVGWGVISEEDKKGGAFLNLSAGGVIDTRDIEPWPTRGLWEELSITFGIPLVNASQALWSLRAIHRHYLTIIHDRLIVAHRLQYLTFLNDQAPFYMLQQIGGQDDIRGVRFSRLMGLGIASANVELRWKVFKTVFFNQNIYGGINLFYDTGVVTKRVALDRTGVPSGYLPYLSDSEETLHNAAGIGVKGALNENFIIAVDYGKALDKRDGDSGVYITLGWLF